MSGQQRWQRGRGHGAALGNQGRGKSGPYARPNQQQPKRWNIEQQSPRNKVDGLTHRLLKLYMEKNWNPQAKALNLANLIESPDLSDMVPDFNKNMFCQKLCKIITETEEFAKNLESINLAGNKIYTLRHFCSAMQAYQLPLQNLCLSNNIIKELGEVDHLAEVKLREVMLDGNPVASRGDEYHRYVVKKLKTIQLLDGVDVRAWRKELLPKLPEVADSFCPQQEHGALIMAFCQRYYKCVDEGDLSSLSDAYTNDAIFSYTLERDPVPSQNHGKANAYHSGLFHKSHNLKTKRNADNTANVKCKRDLVITSLRQLYGLDHGWKMSHAVEQFKLDAFPLNDTILCTIHGSYKYWCPDATQIEFKKCFDRTFLLVPNTANTGWPARIANDMLSLRANQVTPIVLPAEDLHTQVKRATGMNDMFVAKLLEQANNNIEFALSLFNENKSQGKIPPEAFM